jgi:hypothetical protein
MEIRTVVDEMKGRNPWIKWRIINPATVDAVVAKLGYDRWYDRCKYDVIYFHEEGKEKALFIWNLTEGPERKDPPKPWDEHADWKEHAAE